jgi:hypothetical protein
LADASESEKAKPPNADADPPLLALKSINKTGDNLT